MEENINKVNAAVEVLKMFCCSQRSCTKCPFGENCGDTPENWKPINADEVG